MRLGQELAQIFVTRPIFDQDRQNAAILNGQFAANDRPHVVFARCDGKSLHAINAVAIEQSHRWHFQFGCDLS